MTTTLADAYYAWLRAETGVDGGVVEDIITYTTADLEWIFYTGLSGLVPVEDYSITDHKKSFFSSQDGVTGTTVDELEASFLRSQGAVGTTLSDLRYNFYTTPGEDFVYVVNNGDGTVGIFNAPVTSNLGTGTVGIYSPAVVTNNGDGTIGIK